MSVDSVLVFICDRCWKQVTPEYCGESPEGWVSVGANDYCDDCADKVK